MRALYRLRRSVALFICPEMARPYSGMTKPMERAARDAWLAGQRVVAKIYLEQEELARQGFIHTEPNRQMSLARKLFRASLGEAVTHQEGRETPPPDARFVATLSDTYFRESYPSFAQSYRLAVLMMGRLGVAPVPLEDAFQLIANEAKARGWPVTPQLSDPEES